MVDEGLGYAFALDKNERKILERTPSGKIGINFVLQET